MGGVLIGSLCSGYGGLDLAALSVFGGQVAWHAEVYPDAAKLLALRFPDVPNLGDITALDWSAVPRVHVLTAGYPCQPMSSTGLRKGVDDERWLWPFVADAVRVLRPAIVVLENVENHLRLGFDHVLRDLAACRFDAEWLVCPASAVGAAHQRKRLFVLAWPADTAGDGRQGRHLPAEPRPEHGQPANPPGPAAADPARLSLGEPPDQALTLATGRTARAQPGRGDRQSDPAGFPWREYQGAITRHAALLGRAAPWPVDDHGRMTPAFVEWFMGLPEGWVTAVPGLSRTSMLHLLGNGVVPQQARAALAELARRAGISTADRPDPEVAR